MLTRRDTLFLIGAATVVTGGALFLNPIHVEPLWAEWFVGPVLVYVGLPIAIIGIAIHFYTANEQSGETKNSAATTPSSLERNARVGSRFVTNSDHNHRGTVDRVALDGEERFIDFIQPELRYSWLHPDFSGDLQEITSVVACHIGDTAKLALSPQKTVIVELGNAIEVDGIDGDDSTFAQATESRDNNRAAWRESNGSVELDGRLVGLCANPLCIHRARQLLVRLTASGDVNFAIPGVQNFDSKMSGRTETKESNPFAALYFGDAQAAEANDAGAQERGCVKIIERGRQRKDEVGTSGGELGVTTVHRVAGEGRRVAKILFVIAAVPAGAVGAADPRDADARPEWELGSRTGDDFADDLMAWDYRRATARQFALGNVKVRTADSAGTDPQPHLTRERLRGWYILDLQRLVDDGCGLGKDGSFHVRLRFTRRSVAVQSEANGKP